MSISLRIGISPRHQGMGRRAALSAAWVLPGAFADLDYENSRFYVNGRVYGSTAEMIAAGVYADTAPPTLLSLPASPFYAVAECTAPGTINAVQVIFQITGPSSSAATARRNPSDGSAGTANGIRQTNLVGGVTTTAGDRAIGNGVRFSSAHQWLDSNYRQSVNSQAVQATTTASRPTLSSLTTGYIGASSTNTSPWTGGTIHRLTFFAGTPADDAAIVALAQQPLVIGSGAGGQLPMNYAAVPVFGEYLAMTWLDSAGNSLFGRIGLKTKKLQATKVFTLASDLGGLDDHHVAARGVSNNKLIALQAGHSDNILRFFRSTDLDPANFGAAVDVATQLSLTNLTYATLVNMPDGSLLGMTQVADLKWQPFISTDEGDTWTLKKAFVVGSGGSPAQYYFALADSAPTAYGFALQHSGNVQNPLKLLTWNKTTGAVEDSTGVKGTIDDANPTTALCTFGDMAAIRTPAANRSQGTICIAVDVSGRPHALLRDFVNADGSDARYWHGMYGGSGSVFDGANWVWSEITAAGLGVAICFDLQDTSLQTAYLVKEAAGTSTLEKWTTTDNWATSASAATLDTSATVYRWLLPTGRSEIPVIWHRGTFTSDTVFAMTMRWA